jgi:hypothetical protein
MRQCTQCRLKIRSHVWVVDGREFCGKGCICAYLGHRHHPKKRFCDNCRGPQVYGKDKKPEFEIIRSRKKMNKRLKSHASRRGMKTRP